jgi:allophanate hydrolase subunit 2
VGVVCSADLDRLGQLCPGDKVSFFGVSLEEAERAMDEKSRRLKQATTFALLSSRA